MPTTDMRGAPGEETPFFFRRQERNLFAVLHRPPGTAARETFVFCHPFGEEKLWTHRVFVSYARRLAAAGNTVFRFDQRGNGDSEGAFNETSVATACADIVAAVAEARRQTGADRVTLLGLRFGATMASLVADDAADIGRLVLWAPIVDGARYMQDLLRINVLTQTATFKEVRQDREQLVAALRSGQTVNVDGYDMGREMYESAASLDLSARPHAFSGSCLIVQIDPQSRPAPDLQRLAASYPNATVMLAREEPFWKEIPRFYQEAAELFAVTDAWLGRGVRESVEAAG